MGMTNLGPLAPSFIRQSTPAPLRRYKRPKDQNMLGAICQAGPINTLDYYTSGKPVLFQAHQGSVTTLPCMKSGSHFTSIVLLTMKTTASKPYVQITIHPWYMQPIEHLGWPALLVQPSNILLGSSIYSLTFQRVSGEL